MKKTKILMPLTGVAALGAVTPVIMATTSCNKNKGEETVTLKSITATDSKAAERTLWSEISKEEITVTATYSDETTKTIETSAWESENFDAEGKHRFNDWTDTLNITYKEGDVVVTTTVEYTDIKAPGTVEFGLGTYYMYIGTDKTATPGTTYNVTTTKRLGLVGDLTGALIDPSLFTFSSSKESEVSVDTNGIVTAKAKTTEIGGATITATWKNEKVSPRSFTCKVAVVADDFDFGQALTLDDTTKSAQYTVQNALASTDGTVIVPRSVIYTKSGETSGTTYNVTSINTGYFSTSYDDVKTLVLPDTIESIPSNTFENGSLINAYYNGTVEQYEAADLDNGWYGDQVVTIQCLDGTSAIDHRYDSEMQDESPATYTTGKYLEATSTLGGAFAQTYTVKFNLGQFPGTWTPDGKTQIRFYDNEFLIGETLVTGVTVSAVYIDGVEATANTSGTFVAGEDYYYNAGKIIFNTDTATAAAHKISTTSVITINFTTPLGHAVRKIHAIAAEFVNA